MDAVLQKFKGGIRYVNKYLQIVFEPVLPPAKKFLASATLYL